MVFGAIYVRAAVATQIAASMLLFGCDKPAKVEELGTVEQNNRILVTGRMSADASEEDAERFGEQYLVEPVVFVYIYEPGIEVPDVGSVANIGAADDLVHSGSVWRYAYVRGLNGTVTLIDCSRDNVGGLSDILCRN